MSVQLSLRMAEESIIPEQRMFCSLARDVCLSNVDDMRLSAASIPANPLSMLCCCLYAYSLVLFDPSFNDHLSRSKLSTAPVPLSKEGVAQRQALAAPQLVAQI